MHLKSPEGRAKKVVVPEIDLQKTTAFFLDAGDYLDLAFIFGVSKDFGRLDLMATARGFLDHAMYTLGKNYVKSEIRRKYKVQSYKKWIERYDKKVII